MGVRPTGVQVAGDGTGEKFVLHKYISWRYPPFRPRVAFSIFSYRTYIGQISVSYFRISDPYRSNVGVISICRRGGFKSLSRKSCPPGFCSCPPFLTALRTTHPYTHTHICVCVCVCVMCVCVRVSFRTKCVVANQWLKKKRPVYVYQWPKKKRSVMRTNG